MVMLPIPDDVTVSMVIAECPVFKALIQTRTGKNLFETAVCLINQPIPRSGFVLRGEFRTPAAPETLHDNRMTAVEHNERKTCHCFMSVRHQDRRTYLVWQRLPGRATAASMSRQSRIPSPRAASPRECRSATQANSPSAPLGPKRADARLWTSAFQAATRVQ